MAVRVVSLGFRTNGPRSRSAYIYLFSSRQYAHRHRWLLSCLAAGVPLRPILLRRLRNTALVHRGVPALNPFSARHRSPKAASRWSTATRLPVDSAKCKRRGAARQPEEKEISGSFALYLQGLLWPRGGSQDLLVLLARADAYCLALPVPRRSVISAYQSPPEGKDTGAHRLLVDRTEWGGGH